MNEVITILNFAKTIYDNEDIHAKIDNAVNMLKGRPGKADSEVIAILKSLKTAYTDEDIRVEFDIALKLLGAQT